MWFIPVEIYPCTAFSAQISQALPYAGVKTSLIKVSPQIFLQYFSVICESEVSARLESSMHIIQSDIHCSLSSTLSSFPNCQNETNHIPKFTTQPRHTMSNFSNHVSLGTPNLSREFVQFQTVTTVGRTIAYNYVQLNLRVLSQILTHATHRVS